MLLSNIEPLDDVERHVELQLVPFAQSLRPTAVRWSFWLSRCIGSVCDDDWLQRALTLSLNPGILVQKFSNLNLLGLRGQCGLERTSGQWSEGPVGKA